MHEHPPASIHVRRHLTARERETIAVALELLADLNAPETIARARERANCFDSILDDQQIVALRYELMNALKVKVCRSKHTPL